MSVTVESFVQRREPRYRACGERPIVVYLQWNEDHASKDAVGTIVDLSPSGMKLSAKDSLEDATLTKVRIQAADIGIEFESHAEVCWSRQIQNGRWHMGCMFTSPLPDDLLNRLAEAGYLDRRTETRMAATLDVKIRKELSGDEVVDAALRDYSPGGCRIVSPSPLGTSDRLLIEVPLETGGISRVPARPIWQESVDNEFHIGCQFFNRPSYETLRRIVESAVEPQAEPEQSMRLRPAFWLALVVVVAAATIRGWLF